MTLLQNTAFILALFILSIFGSFQLFDTIYETQVIQEARQ